jgi:hypothetical protein
MERSEIERLKIAMRAEYEAKITKLKEELEIVLSSLSRAEETLCVSKIVQPSLFPPTQAPKAKRLKKALRRKMIPTVAKRIAAALDRMDGEFGTAELLAAVNSDGFEKEVKRNVFMPEFSTLKKENKIIVVREYHGNVPGIYRKAGTTPPALRTSE